MPSPKIAVIPAQAGIQVVHLIGLKCNQPYELDSRLRGNDGRRMVGRRFAPQAGAPTS